jgi:mutator protein MutT
MPTEPHAKANSVKPDDFKIVEVAAGLLFREGRLLIAQRHRESHLGGLWEFPGGKREPKETFEAALVRELREELGVLVSVGRVIDTVEHVYPEKHVRIRFFLCTLKEGEPQAMECQNLRWIQQSELASHVFPAADAHLIEQLLSEPRFWAVDSSPKAG